MSLQFIIDGYNLINHPSFANLASRKTKNRRIALLELIRSFRLTGSPKNNTVVVFDGYPDPNDSYEANYLAASPVNVVFSRSISADERIKKLADRCANPKNTVTVTDDKELRLYVRALKGKVIGVEEFLSPKEKAGCRRNDEAEAELSFTQKERINQELRKLWLTT